MADWPPVQQRLPSLLPRPILFAHRGARAYAPENTIAAFELALRLGATGLESDVWVTADRIAVLDHDGEVRRGRWRKQPIAEIARGDLPEHIPTLAEMIDHCGRDYQLSLDLKDEDSGALVVATIRHHFPEMMGSTWLCHHHLPKLIELRPLDHDVKLVDSTRLSKLSEGPERHAATLAEHGIDAVNMRGAQWTGGLTSLYHRFERAAFGWDLQHDYQLETAIRMGLDGVYSDYVDRMADVAARETPG
jgi:glycerophosphoryl diester phosphodiesterase